MRVIMRSILSAFVVGVTMAAAAALAGAQAKATPVPIKIFKTPTCGCCQKWVEHMRAAGFAPEVEDMPSVAPVKDRSHVPDALRSCHTALVGGYAVEGHVPADVVLRLLREKPKVAGIAVPGMPVGSPGMEMGDRKDPYEVVAFTADGKTSTYEKR
jgi:hypothetical protein